MTRRSRFWTVAAGIIALAMLTLTPAAQAAGSIRIAFGDIATVETLNFLIAVERAKERGVGIDITYFKSEDIAAQAVVGGQADVGVGAPYTLLQKVKAPIRIFYQMSTLRFFPVVNTDFYQDWKDLDGQEIAVHSRGSGTEAIMQLMAARNGIKFANISYVPGSEVRTTALLQGHVKATVVDSAGMRILQQQGGDRFKALPMEAVDATDEALYANLAFLEREAVAVSILVEELLATWREINKNPAYVVEQRAKYKLLPDLPKELEAEVLPFYEDAVANKVYPNNGGGVAAARADFEFNALAGKLAGKPDELKVEDFWALGPLEAALARLGQA
jgi:NitT/TauT family transport system substrate-binding protein